MLAPPSKVKFWQKPNFENYQTTNLDESSSSSSSSGSSCESTCDGIFPGYASEAFSSGSPVATPGYNAVTSKLLELSSEQRRLLQQRRKTLANPMSYDYPRLSLPRRSLPAIPENSAVFVIPSSPPYVETMSPNQIQAVPPTPPPIVSRSSNNNFKISNGSNNFHPEMSKFITKFSDTRMARRHTKHPKRLAIVAFILGGFVVLPISAAAFALAFKAEYSKRSLFWSICLSYMSMFIGLSILWVAAGFALFLEYQREISLHH